MNKEETFYDIHQKKGKEMIAFAEKTGILSLWSRNITECVNNEVKNDYHVIYISKPMFYFTLKTTINQNINKVETIIYKEDNFIKKIDTKEDINNFIDICLGFVKRLIQDNEIINNTFYTSEYQIFREEIILKKIFDKESKIIKINFDGTYTLILDKERENKINFKSLDELKNSEHLQSYIKNVFFNFLKVIHIF